MDLLKDRYKLYYIRYKNNYEHIKETLRL
jgi:hypothetical protein